jgi:peptidoglycan/xylan/chitin deacetylase (PgdA/CDA1 family)
MIGLLAPRALRAAWRAARGRLRPRPGPLILLYHRVAEPSEDPFELAVSPTHFAEQLDWLDRQAQPIALSQLDAVQRAGRPPRRAVAISFDDGYLDNLTTAAPLLERHDLPATIFVTSGQLGSSREFWWDELARLLLGPLSLPSTLVLTLNGQQHRWQLDPRDADPADRCRWRYGQPSAPDSRQRLFQEFYDLLKPAPPPTREAALELLRDQAGAPAEAHPLARALSPDELRQLAHAGLIEIGAHTVSHPPLDALLADAQRAEIGGSKAQLEALLDQPVQSFAYPHGLHDRSALQAVREAGFVRACTTAGLPLPPRADPFRLPRLVVGNWDGDTFGRRLAPWLA